MKWLHLSDLHIRDNADWNIYVKDLIKLCGDRGPIDLVIVTGDFHNFEDKSDFSKSSQFLKELIEKLKLDINKDLFLVPGNHDGSSPIAKFKEAFAEHIKADCNNINPEEWDELVSQFDAYEEFVHGLIENYPEKHPARIHCRKWRDNINFMHLNTAVVADGKSKNKQVVDIDVIASLELPQDIPTIMLAHNHFNDLHEEQQERLKGVMRTENICAYFCGDRHVQAVNQIMIKDIQNQQIPCIVSYKSSADAKDRYSSYGVIIGSWEKEKAELRGWTWKPGEGFQVDSKITDQTIEMGKAYRDIFDTKATEPLIQNCTIDECDSHPKEIQEEKEYSNNWEWRFRKYYHNMSDNQIDIFNRKYSNRVRKLQRAESNEELKEYVEEADKEGCLIEMLQYMKDIFMKGEKYA